MSIPFPDIDPVAFHLGPLPVRWYALAYMAGFLLGWRYALRLAGLDGEKTIRKLQIDDFLTWAILGVILGGRIGYILFYQFDVYREDPLEILKLWHGGMSFHGGAAGVIVALLLFAWKYKINLLRFGDIVCPVVPIGLFFGRLANFINGELFGRVTDVPWGVVFPYGGAAPRHPSQLYEAGLEGLVLGLILAVMAHMRAVREKPGLISGVFLAGYALARGTVEFFREPDVQIGYIATSFTMGQVLCVPMLIAGLWLAGRALLRKS